MCHQQEIVDELQSINSLRLSLQEELQAIIDYKNRALMDKTNKDLFNHLAQEESRHFAELLERVVAGIPELDDILIVKVIPE